MSSRNKLKHLYVKIGGNTPLREILRDFYRRMSLDLMIGFFFQDKNIEAIADKQTEFLLVAMGISPKFTGRSPSQAHLSLPPILPGHFDRRLVILKETLNDHGLSAEDIEVWLNFEEAFRDVVVSKLVK